MKQVNFEEFDLENGFRLLIFTNTSESIQKFEEKYRIAYKSIMELIITNFENKNNAEAK